LMVAWNLFSVGQLEDAETAARSSVERFDAQGETWAIVSPLIALAYIAEARGDLDGASAAYQTHLQRCRAAGHLTYLPLSLIPLAGLRARQGDNAAADILLRLVGDPQAVSAYMASIGVSGFHLQDGEHTLHREMAAQYRNWFEPSGAVQLLRRISDNSPLTPKNTDLLLNWMLPSGRTKRLEADLPEGTRVAHKSGTSDVDNGVAHATNDIALISLPDGRKLAIAVFVTDSTADQETRERVIARIGKAAYDAATGPSGRVR